MAQLRDVVCTRGSRKSRSGEDEARAWVGTSSHQYTSEILVSILGFAIWPLLFMKCFTARSARLVQLSVVLCPTFLVFRVPLVFLGYVAVLEGGPANDGVLSRVTGLPRVQAGFGSLGPAALAVVSVAVLPASMSTGDAPFSFCPSSCSDSTGIVPTQLARSGA